MFIAFTLGLMGSIGHCVGMCGAIVLLISRQQELSGWRLLLVHLGRITTYSMLGFVAGTLGYTVGMALADLRQIQGLLALSIAGMSIYLALALIGQAQSPELYLVSLTKQWGKTMRGLTTQNEARKESFLYTYLLGIMWGALPCGLVLTALLTAGVAGSPLLGALTMTAFGVGTLPALIGVDWIARRDLLKINSWSRQVAAVVILLFGIQMGFRGLAIWGLVNHLHVGSVIIW